MPPLRSTAAGQGQATDEPASSSDTEVAGYEGGGEGSHTPSAAAQQQSFRSGQYPHQPSSMSLQPTMFEGNVSAGGGGTGRGEMMGAAGGRQLPGAITSIGRNYDPAAEAERSSEHHDHSHTPYPTPLRSSYTRTQQPQAALFSGQSAASSSTPYYPTAESFTFPPPVGPPHREQQQQHQQHQQHATLPPAWHTRPEPDNAGSFQRMDFESFAVPNRANEWRTVTAEEARPGQASSSYDPRSRYAGQQELQYAQYWPQTYDPTYIDPTLSARYQPNRPEYRDYYQQLESFRRSPSKL